MPAAPTYTPIVPTVHKPTRTATEHITAHRPSYFTHTENLSPHGISAGAAAIDNTNRLLHDKDTQKGLKSHLTNPILPISLHWLPDHQPTKTDMLGAAVDALRTLEIHHRQALFIGSMDPNPHVRIILNRHHPATGENLHLPNLKRRLATWANEYNPKTTKEPQRISRTSEQKPPDKEHDLDDRER